MRRAELSIEPASAGTCRELMVLVALCVEAHAESEGQQWIRECRCMQRAELGTGHESADYRSIQRAEGGSGHVCAGECRQQSCAVGKGVHAVSRDVQWVC